MEQETRTIYTTSPEETEQVAARIAANLRGGEVIELASDLGGGKTTFTRGLAAGLQSTDPVASPTFTLSREYSGGRLHIYHFDFYRLHEAGIMSDELAELIGDPEGVVVVEWSDVVQNVLPQDRLSIAITATSETQRTIVVTVSGSQKYLLEHV